MIPRDYLLLIISIWLTSDIVSGDRWSRQVSNSEWIPLANPRSQLLHASGSNQSPIQSLNLPPHLRQEYHQQINQLQKTQDSIQNLLLIQQQLRNQQTILQNQAYLPNAVGPDEEKQAFHQSTINNDRGLPELTPDILTPPQLTSDDVPSAYAPQEFRKTQSFQQGQFEVEAPNGPGIRDDNYTPVAPSGSSIDEEKREDGEEEIQVVYVPAETLAQRGQSKEERNRDHKQFKFPHSQRHQQQHRYQEQLQESPISGPEQQHNSFNSEFIQFPRNRDEQDEFLKNARQKELDRLNAERLEIQRQTRLQTASMQREQERIRQKDAEKKRKELVKIEEAARQRELNRLEQVSRERQELDKLERAKERAAKERQAEIDRLAALEQQKKAELEKLVRKEEEERVTNLANRDQDISEIATAEHLVKHHQQHHTETVTPHKPSRYRNKPRHRINNNHRQTEDEKIQEGPTVAPTPNQPPLAVFMGSRDHDIQDVKIGDVLRVLRNAKTIAVLDQIAIDAPKVFVGPSNLEPPQRYVKFDLPYLSSLDTNRVERRVDKLPFFVAPLSFNPPSGYSKIPFPSPHIGSVIVNNIEPNAPTVERLESSQKYNSNPLYQPNSYVTGAGQGTSFQPTYENPTTPYTSFIHDHVTPQYQSSSIYSPTINDRFRYRPQQYEQPPPQNLANQQSVSASPYQEQVTAPIRPHHQYSMENVQSPVTQANYRTPTIVSSYSYEQDPVSTTPTYQDNYSHTRIQPNRGQELTSQLSQINQHDYSQHHHAANQYQHPSVQTNLNQQHHISTVQNVYDDQHRGSIDQSQYSLPAELPPIHPQLPGLVNSLLEQKEDDQQTITTTTTTPAPTTTTTEIPTSTSRVRTRQRVRIATRPPTTTSTTTSTSLTSKSQTDRTRRPFNRSRSRFTTTTEEYRESSTYEPTRTKVSETTQKSIPTEQYLLRRSTTPRIPKSKNHDVDGPSYESTTSNQIQNVQSHEPVSDEGSSTEDSKNQRDAAYSQYNSPIHGENLPNAYLNRETLDNPANTDDIDYSKTPNYPRTIAIQQQRYQDRYQSPHTDFQGNTEDQVSDKLNYQIGDETFDQIPTTSPLPNDYYYQDKKNKNEESSSTDAPAYTQFSEYTPGTKSELVQQNKFSNDNNQYGGEQNKAHVEQGYIEYVSQEPVETTTEQIIATTTPPAVIRQRVRARLGGRNRPESPVQTQPRDSQEEYVRFSAVNQTPGGRTTPVSSRQRDPTRTRAKSRPHHHQAEVQSEGNEYVRIQSSNRSNYPKTIVQTAATSPKTTTTTQAPLTTTEETSQLDNGNEFGFIRQPNFNQPQNHLSSRYRAPSSESQTNLQNVAPTDETAEDSSPTRTEVPKHRQKYQSPNRPRPTIKSSLNPTTTTTTTTSPTIEGYTNKPHVRNEEPKNRIRTKVRRPGARKRPTTTSTTTEYVLDGNNNLPLDENYPRVPITRTESTIERHSIFDASYEGLPQGTQADYHRENYPIQNFPINFGENSNSEEQQDQSPPQPARRHRINSSSHRTSSGSRLKSYTNQAESPERDIYGAESQWSTKLTKSSFQPSNANQLNRDGEKSLSLDQENSDVKDNGSPEIITAQPEDAFMSVLVTSDDEHNGTKKAQNPEEATSETTEFKEKISESTTIAQQNAEESTDLPVRKNGARRRRVRIRVRPAPVDDFVTAESQHINSAVNSLVQDGGKHNYFDDNQRSTSRIPVGVDQRNPVELTESLKVDQSIGSTDTTTINYTEVPEQTKATEVFTVLPMNNEETTESKIDDNGITIATENSAMEIDTTLTDIPTTTSIPTTEMGIKKSWDTSKAYNEWLVKRPGKYFSSSQKLMKEYGNNEEKNENNESKNADESTENYPKNHRSEWSEVRYPSNRGVYGYARSEVFTPTTELPGVVTKSVSETSVKTLSDYVQAIFDTMKSADDERGLVDNAPDLWGGKIKSSSSSPIFDLSSVTMNHDISTTESTILKNKAEFEKNSTEDEESTTETTKLPEISNTSTTSKPSEGSTTLKFQMDNEKIVTMPKIATMPGMSINDQTSINNTQTKLGAILRTSTTTKVSHMTEICYRGRCVMTKPRKDFHEK